MKFGDKILYVDPNQGIAYKCIFLSYGEVEGVCNIILEGSLSPHAVPVELLGSSW